MITATFEQYPAADFARPETGPTMTRLTAVELRKMVDTRAGFWLLAAGGLIGAAGVAIAVLPATASNPSLDSIFTSSSAATRSLLALLGILTVTSEWKQRTALTTFTQVPVRGLVVTAKLAAAICLSGLFLLVSLLLALIGNLLVPALQQSGGNWSLPIATLGAALLAGVLSAVMGVAFGMVLLNTAPAIVTYLLLPSIVAAVLALVPGLSTTGNWLSMSNVTGTALATHAGPETWAHLLAASLLWVALPLVLGTWRMLHAEVK